MKDKGILLDMYQHSLSIFIDIKNFDISFIWLCEIRWDIGVSWNYTLTSNVELRETTSVLLIPFTVVRQSVSLRRTQINADVFVMLHKT